MRKITHLNNQLHKITHLRSNMFKITQQMCNFMYFAVLILGHYAENYLSVCQQ